MNTEHNHMIRRLADSLMIGVYYPFSLCVWIGECGRIMRLWQFDTAFCTPPVDTALEASQVWLLSNHSNGDMRPGEEDLRNISRIRQTHQRMTCRLFVVSEDEGIQEIEC